MSWLRHKLFGCSVCDRLQALVDDMKAYNAANRQLAEARETHARVLKTMKEHAA